MEQRPFPPRTVAATGYGTAHYGAEARPFAGQARLQVRTRLDGFELFWGGRITAHRGVPCRLIPGRSPR